MLEIIKGKKQIGKKMVIMGVPGVGKTTLCSHMPKPLFIDVEGNFNKVMTTKKVKSNNTRCKFCRKCYNTGLCLMPWPGFDFPGKDVRSKNTKSNIQR